MEPAVKLGILDFGDTPWLETLRGPIRSIPLNMRLFFTENRWREIGRYVVAEFKPQDQEVRFIAVKEASTNVVWDDEYEAATQSKSPRSNKNNMFNVNNG